MAGFLDLTPLLLEARQKQLVFHRTDTHWNDSGCWLGYREIMARLGLAPQSQDAFLLHTGEFHGDLTELLGLKTFLTETTTAFYPKAACARDSAALEPSWAAQREAFALDCPGREGRLLLIGDSFARWRLMYFLAEHFGRTVFVHRMRAPMPPAVLEEVVAWERPTVCIEESVGRELGEPVPEPAFLAPEKASAQ